MKKSIQALLYFFLFFISTFQPTHQTQNEQPKFNIRRIRRILPSLDLNTFSEEKQSATNSVFPFEIDLKPRIQRLTVKPASLSPSSKNSLVSGHDIAEEKIENGNGNDADYDLSKITIGNRYLGTRRACPTGKFLDMNGKCVVSNGSWGKKSGGQEKRSNRK